MPIMAGGAQSNTYGGLREWIKLNYPHGGGDREAKGRKERRGRVVAKRGKEVRREEK